MIGNLKTIPASPYVPFLLVFYEIATYLSNDMYLPGVPQMMRDLGLSTSQAQLTLTVWFLGQASLPLIVGAMADRYGRRPILLGGGVLYILATMLCAVSTQFHLLLAGRLIEGGMVASMLVSGYACIHELYEQKQAVKILALMGSISVLAPAFGPLLGSLVLFVSDWRGIFWFIVIWSSIAVLLLARWMPETLAPSKREAIHFGTLLINYGRLFINKKFILSVCVLGFIFAGWIAWISSGPLLVMETYSFSAFAFGIIQAIIFAAFILGSRLVKYLIERIPIHALIAYGLTITLSGSALLFLCAILLPHSLYPFLAAMLIYSLGSGLCFAPLNRMIIETSTAPMGLRVAMFGMFISNFAALGSGLSGLFFNGSLLSLAIIMFSAALLASILRFISTVIQ